MPITMHYVRILCDKYFLIFMGVFSLFVTGRFRHRVLKYGVGIQLDPRITAAWVPFYINPFFPIVYYFSPEILIF